MKKERTVVRTLFALIACLVFCPVAWAQTGGDSSDLDAISKKVEDYVATESDFNKLTELLKQRPKDAKLHYLIGLYLESKGFEQLAVDSYTRSIACDSSFKLPHYMRCGVLLRTNDLEAGMKEVQQCEKFFAEDGDKLFVIGQALDQAGKRDDAKRLFHEASLAGHRDKGYGLVLAKIRFRQGKFDEAIEAVDWDLKSNKNDPAANLFRGEILDAIKLPDEAVPYYLRAVRSGPCNKSTAMIVAKKFLERKRYPDALTAALFDLTCPKRNAAEMAESKKFVSDLIQRLPEQETQKIIDAAAEDVQRLRRCLYFRLSLGDIYDRLNKPNQAIEQYERAIHSCSVPLTETNLVARGYYRLGRDFELSVRNHGEALNLYLRAHLMSPDDREIALNYDRLNKRMINRKNDVAAQIKDFWYWLWQKILPESH